MNNMISIDFPIFGLDLTTYYLEGWWVWWAKTFLVLVKHGRIFGLGASLVDGMSRRNLCETVGGIWIATFHWCYVYICLPAPSRSPQLQWTSALTSICNDLHISFTSFFFSTHLYVTLLSYENPHLPAKWPDRKCNVPPWRNNQGMVPCPNGGWSPTPETTGLDCRVILQASCWAVLAVFPRFNQRFSSEPVEE